MASYDEQVSAFRSPAFKRKEKRLRIWESDKKLIALHKEDKSISRQQWDLGFEPLDPPIQRGWKRTFVLRHDVKASPDADFFQGLLDKINHVQYSHRRDFKNKKKRRGRKVQVERIQQLKELSEYSYAKAKLTPKQQKYFREEEEISPVRKHVRTKKYVFTAPWKFVLKVTPHMITQVKIIDPELERRSAEISHYIDGRHLWPRLDKITGRSYSNKKRWGDSPKERYRHTLSYNFLRNELEEYYETRAEGCGKNN